MKVTKLIREYVTEQVSKAFSNKKNPFSEQAEKDRRTLKEFGETLRKEQQQAINAFTSEHELFYYSYSQNDFVPFHATAQGPGFGNCETKAMVEADKWETKNCRAKAAKVREILLRLELGATKQELDDMIAKLTEEYK